MLWRVLVSNLLEFNLSPSLISFGISGNIVVFTGILGVAKDEDGLAAVLGHGTNRV
jgi:Zn-dependent protease with chaperone function